MSGPYLAAVGVGALAVAASCAGALARPGRWTGPVARGIGLLLAGDAVTWMAGQVAGGSWSAKTDLPLALCDAALLVAAAACWWRTPLLVELTYFWGLAGTLQAIVTPDLSVGYPHLMFFEYVVAHVAIVWAALFLVVGLRHRPRPHAVPRVFAVTAAYTACVGLVDALTGADYMFLRAPPPHPTLLSVLGGWPYYIFSATAVALVLLVLLDAPFRRGRAAAAAPARERPAGRLLGLPGHANGG